MTQDADTYAKKPAPTGRSGMRRPQVRVGAVIAIALLAAFVVWLVVRGGNSSSNPVPKRATAVPISPSGLRTLAGAVHSPIYWAGPKRGFTYELSKTADNRVYIRYLPSGVSVGSDKPYLTIGTYPIPNAFSVTSKLAKKSTSVKVAVGSGGIALYDKKSPTNIYLAYPDSDYQVEVYDPSASRALQVATSGQVRPVTSGTASSSASSSAPKAASPAELKSLAASLQHPVYWAGAQSGVTYELTKTSDGRVYVRYLPAGVAVGVRKPYLSVGTYPLKNAFKLTSALLHKKGEVRISIGGGGVALYNNARPTNVYIAYPGIDVQVEVYDPSAASAHGLVASQRVSPVG